MRYRAAPLPACLVRPSNLNAVMRPRQADAPADSAYHRTAGAIFSRAIATINDKLIAQGHPDMAASKGGLGKTARSSTIFDREAGNKPSGHVCVSCTKPIIIREHLPVMQMPGRRMAHYHRACYQAS